MRSIEVRVEVGHAIGAAAQEIAATIHLPDHRPERERQIVIFASPGGGYTRQYYDMRLPGHHGYSEAEYHTGRGIIFIAMDHLGVGESSLDRVESLSIEQAADTNAAFVSEMLCRLKDGTIAGIGALVDPFVIGMGQSMGAGVTVVMQGRSHPFEAIVLLGKSVLHTMLPQPTPEQFEIQRSIFLFSRATPPDELLITASADLMPDFRYPFHWPEEPEDIVAADMGGGYPVRAAAPAFGSMTVPRYAVAMMSPGFLTPDAARVRVPVLIAGGERDVMPDARREPTAFLNARDVSLFIVPRMAHMHNFAPTRHILWRRVADWARMQSGSGGD